MSVYTVYVEKEQSEGRVDCIVETPNFVYIFEFKLDGTAQKALQQIEDKGYARPYEADARTVYKIGANFSSETGTINDWVSTMQWYKHNENILRVILKNWFLESPLLNNVPLPNLKVKQAYLKKNLYICYMFS